MVAIARVHTALSILLVGLIDDDNFAVLLPRVQIAPDSTIVIGTEGKHCRFGEPTSHTDVMTNH